MSSIEERKVLEIEVSTEKYIDDYHLTVQKVAKSGAIYHDAPVPFLYLPKVFTKEDINHFDAAIKDVFKIVNRTIGLYMSESKVRTLFGFDPKLEELILCDSEGHGYKSNVPMGRFDIFYYPDGNYMFCELNTDGASAMNEEMELTSILLSSFPMQELAEHYKIKRFELFESWVEEVRSIYNEFLASNNFPPVSKNTPENYSDITVAILDFKDTGNLLEFGVFQKYFENAGFRCVIADPRDLKYERGELFFEGHKINIIYRRLVTGDFMCRYDEVPELIKGIRSKKTCIIGPIKSQIVHTKRFFEVLHHPVFRSFLSEEEIDYIDRHIPLTKRLENNDELHGYISHKDQYIIKPFDGYASSGVFSGKDFSMADWDSLIREKAAGKTYIIQKYCPLPVSRNITKDEAGELIFGDFYNLTGLFAYNQKFAGLYSRAGQNAIISGQHNGYTMSSVYVE